MDLTKKITGLSASLLLLAFCLIAVISILPQTINAQGLPPEVQFEISSSQLVENLKAKNYKKVLSTIKTLKSLDLPLPSSVIFFEGQAHMETGNTSEAEAALTKYLIEAGRDGQFYAQAITLMGRVQSKAQEEREKVEAEERRRQEEIARKEEQREEEALALRQKFVDRGARVWLGASYVKNTEYKGVNLTKIYKGSPAEKGGFQVGDHVFFNDIDGEITDTGHFTKLIRGRNPGDAIKFKYFRNGKNHLTTITLERP